MYLTSVTQSVAQQSPELNDWVRVLNILAALNVGTLFGHVALSSKGQYSFFPPFESWQINSNLRPANGIQGDDDYKKDIILINVIQETLLGQYPPCL